MTSALKSILMAKMAVALLSTVFWGVHPWMPTLAALSGFAFFAGEPAQAQNQDAESVAKFAEAITVRIEGATQGSGVLMKREGNRYTVLTAWHVVSGQRPGEELAIITPDGKQHQLEQGSIQKLGQADLAILRFVSSSDYRTARLGMKKGVAAGNLIFVAGFPLATSTAPSRVFRFLEGRVVANTEAAMPNGYQLLYSSGLQPTMPGMSGGPVLDRQGQLAGIHGRSETEDLKTERDGVFVKTGTNFAIPVNAERLSILEPLMASEVSTGSRAFNMKSQSQEPSPPLRSQNSLSNQGVSIPNNSLSPGSSRLLAPLEEALASGNLIQADKITKTLILESIGAPELLSESLANALDCQFLLGINEVWMSRSKNRYGLEVQSRLYSGSLQDFEATVGWRVGGFLVSSQSYAGEIPQGHFPRAIANGPIIRSLLLRFRQCRPKA